MSEELISRNLIKKGFEIVDFEFFPTHSTTIKQYKQAKIINNFDYAEYENKKPDGLLIDRRNKKNQQIIVSLEYKKPSEFQTDKQKKSAFEQCNDLCQVLNAKIGVITDGIVTYWINPYKNDSKNDYLDKKTKRSYTFILKEDKKRLSSKFFIKEKSEKNINKLDDETKETYQLIHRILQEINNNNSELKPSEQSDPSKLARSVWQSIYISTKENPTACLYNVVEIFIFKFLSDLNVLRGNYSFNHLVNMYKDKENTDESVLEHYANICRKKIKDLFEEGDDGTTIINGTIFVNKDGSAVLSQSTLFKDTIEKYSKFGNLRNIKKDFKTKLFETFLKQSKDKSRLGQFFTPRKIVTSIVEMADIDKADYICDPFCGVGGFVLEPFQVSNSLKNKFSPQNGVINSNIRMLGLDCGREDNEEQKRTIILAKANMLIYLSDLIEKNPTLNKEFGKLINNSFKFLSNSNLGTLNIKLENEEDKPDLILTNPPYITSGVKSIKKEIKTEGLEDFYINSGKGVEGLSLKWIIESLRKGGQAFIIVPTTILSKSPNLNLRNEILKKCYIDGIISLPSKTFFNTPQKTYILILTKKEDEEIEQDFPVFTYLVSKIGESLDINRFAEEENDLENAKQLFNQFKNAKQYFKTDDSRCKILDISEFKSKSWVIEKWWEIEEKIKLGIEEAEPLSSVNQFRDKIIHLTNELKTYEKQIEGFKVNKYLSIPILKTKENEKGIFEFDRGNSKLTLKYLFENKGEFPVYSSNTKQEGLMGYTNSYEKDTECLIITTNGVNAGTIFYKPKHKFSMNGDCAVLTKNNDNLDYQYLLYTMRKAIKLEGFNWENKVSPEKLEDIEIEIPVDKNGFFDLKKQKEIADKYRRIEEMKKKLENDWSEIFNLEIDFENS